jgi:hypothetical protein
VSRRAVVLRLSDEQANALQAATVEALVRWAELCRESIEAADEAYHAGRRGDAVQAEMVQEFEDDAAAFARELHRLASVLLVLDPDGAADLMADTDGAACICGAPVGPGRRSCGKCC